MDKFLLGLCAVMIPLQIWSLWLPSNHIFLVVCIITSVVYWIINKKRFVRAFARIKELIKKLPVAGLGAIAILFFVIFFSNLFTDDIFDSLFYHYQNIKWNEEYAVVHGLGNIDDRFAFNSGYLLLSAPFTLSVFFGQAVFSLQNVLLMFLGSWIIYEVFRSNYEIKRIILLMTFMLFYLISIKLFQNTSTDLLPNMIVFYLAARLVLYPQSFKTNSLLFIMIPVFLVICKLSVAPFCLLTIYFLICFIHDKNWRVAGFSVIALLLLVLPWLARNVILSGYLVYPLYQIDLFFFDWKIPAEIAILQNEYIYSIGHDYFNKLIHAPMVKYREAVWVNLLSIVTYILAVISILFVCINLIRKKLTVSLFLMAVVLVFILGIWFLKAPDIRFVLGALCAMVLMGFSCFFTSRQEEFRFPMIGKVIIFMSLTCILVWSGWRISDKYAVINQLRATDNNMPPFSESIYRQYSVKHIFESNGFVKKSDFVPYRLSKDIIVYIAPGYTMDDLLPAVAEKGKGGQFLDYHCLEARGEKLQDGFRTRKDCRY